MVAIRHFSLLGFIALAVAFTLPAGIRDGSYKVHLDARGVEVHESIGVDSRSEEALEKRESGPFGVGIYNTWCGCGIGVNSGDTDAAVADLKSQLGGAGVTIQWNQAYYSIRGGVVAFVCNTDEGQTTGKGAVTAWADSDYITTALGYVSQNCGQYIAGTFEFADYAPRPDATPFVGYMNYADGLDFCYEAPLSNSPSC